MSVVGQTFVEVLPDTARFALKLKEDVTKAVDKVEASTTGTGFEKFASIGQKAFMAVGTAAVVMGGYITEEGLKGEESMAQLGVAVEGTGGSFAKVQPHLNELTESMAKFGVTNVAAQNALTRLIQITGNTDKAMSLLQLSVSVATARHTDLSAAAQLVGMVAEGNTQRLRRLIGITIEGTDANDKAAKGLAILQERFGGAAQAQADTYAGKLKAFHAEVQNAGEALGMILIPYLARFTQALGAGLGYLAQHQALIKALAVAIGGPLVAAMTVWIGLQVKQIALNVAASINGIMTAVARLGTVFTGANMAELQLNGGLAALWEQFATGAAVIGLVAVKFYEYQQAQQAGATAADKWVQKQIQGLPTVGAKVDELNKLLKQQQDEVNKTQNKWVGWDNFFARSNKINSAKDNVKALKDQIAALTPAVGQTTGALADAIDPMDAYANSATGAAMSADKFQTGVDALMDKVTASISTQRSYDQALRSQADAAKAVTDAQAALNKLLQQGRVDAKAVETATRELAVANREVVTAQENQAKAQDTLNKLLAAGAVDAKAVETAQRSYDQSVRSTADAQYSLGQAQDALNKLLAAGAVDTKAVDTAQKDLERTTRTLVTAQQDLADAQDAMNQLLAGPSTEDLGKAQLAVSDANIALANAQNSATDAATNQQLTYEDVTATATDKQKADLGLLQSQNNVTKATYAQLDAQAALQKLQDAGKPGSAEYKAAQDKIAAATQKVADALDAQTAATEKLQTAQAGDPDFANKVADAQRNVAQARQGVADSIYTQQQNYQALQTAMAGDPDFQAKVHDAQMAVRDAHQQTADAIQRQHDAHDALATAQAGDPDFDKKITDAKDAVARANQNLGDQMWNVASAAAAHNKAQRDANQALDGAGPLVGGLKNQLDLLGGTYPGVKAVTDTINALKGELPPVAQSSAFFQSIAAAYAAALIPFSQSLTRTSGSSGRLFTADEGGWIPGPIGAAVPMIGHGGEYVVSRDMMSGRTASAMTGVTVGPGAVQVAINVEAGASPETVAMARTVAAEVGQEMMLQLLDGIDRRYGAKVGT